ncbi:hypothetical protein TNCV_2876161 [Trichonephila clavipes]|nr:hypothetical protein TNCV_2876161 [Trichonephila clavipes]
MGWAAKSSEELCVYHVSATIISPRGKTSTMNGLLTEEQKACRIDIKAFKIAMAPIKTNCQNSNYSRAFGNGQWQPSGQGIGSWLACLEFEPRTTEDPPCMGAMHVKSVESSSVLRLCGSWVSTQVSSSSLDRDSKLRGPSPKAIV